MNETLGDILRAKLNQTKENIMLELINAYLASQDLTELYSDEYGCILTLIRDGRKVDAIKTLREQSRNSCDVRLNDTRYPNTFALWLIDNDKMTYTKSRRLGLKEAKDVIDFMIANPEASGL